MLLHELLVILSGYPSSIDPQQFKHPSERQIFEKANRFSEIVAHISSALFKGTQPLVPVIRQVLEEYFEVLVDLERRIDEIDYSTIIAATVDQWGRTLEYSSDLLRSSKYVSMNIVVQLRQDLFSGFPQISEIARNCLAAVDAFYIKELTPWLLWGNMPKIELEYPEFKEVAETVKRIGNLLRNVAFVQADQEFIELTRESHAALQRLSFPLEQYQLKSVLGGIQANINTTLLPHVRAQSNVEYLLIILRSIVLCGSSLFCMSFVETMNGEINTKSLDNALSRYLDTQEIDLQCYTLASDLIYLTESGESDAYSFGDILTAKNVQAELLFNRKFSIFINSTHCDVYGDIFYYLLTVWVINDSLKVFSPETQQSKLVLNTLWAWFQRSIEHTIKQLRALFAGELVSLDNILVSHTTILRELGKKLLLSNRNARMCIKKILINAQASSHEARFTDNPVEQLIQSLSGMNEFSELSIALASIELVESNVPRPLSKDAMEIEQEEEPQPHEKPLEPSELSHHSIASGDF